MSFVKHTMVDGWKAYSTTQRMRVNTEIVSTNTIVSGSKLA